MIVTAPKLCENSGVQMYHVPSLGHTEGYNRRRKRVILSSEEGDVSIICGKEANYRIDCLNLLRFVGIFIGLT